MRQKDLSDAIGLEIERREKAMTFEEWIRQECFKAPPEHSVELAKSAWDYQQQAIDALSLVWAKQQARIKALEAEVQAYRDIRSDSTGVAGYYPNGDSALWDEFDIPEQEGE